MRFTIIIILTCIIGPSIAQIPLSKRDQERKAEFEAMIAAEEKYEELMEAADRAFVAKDYVEARMRYNEAIQYNEEKEQWLTSKVRDLDILLAKNIARRVDSVVVIQQREINAVETSNRETAVLEQREEEVVELREPPMAEEPIVEPDPIPESVPEKPVDTITPQPEAKPIPKPLPKKTEEVEIKVKDDFSDLPQGMTEEFFEFPDHTVTRIVVKDGIDTIVYKYVTHRWGGKFYFKDDISISERIWKEEVDAFRAKYPSESGDK